MKNYKRPKKSSKILPMLLSLMMISVASCKHASMQNQKITTSRETDICVLDNYDGFTVDITPEDTKLGVKRVDQPDCIKGALRQWTLITQ